MRTWREEWEFLHGRPERPIPQYAPSDPVAEISDREKLCAAPTVSVIVTIYNHERWLGKCIESIVGQRTDFAYEVLLCEDCSTDNSLSIAKEWQRRFPERIRVFSWAVNTGGIKNAQVGIVKARGDYIAWVEGDDYWINPFKLQKQVDLLRNDHYRCVVAWNDLLDDSTGKITHQTFPKEREVCFGTYGGEYYHTSTYVCERSLRLELEEIFRYVFAYDTTFFMLALERCGRIGVLNEVVSVYRKTGKGVYTSLSLLEKGERAVGRAALLYKYCPQRMRSWQRAELGNAILDYMIYSIRGGLCSPKLILAFVLALRYSSFRFNSARRILFLWLSLAKSIVLLLAKACRR